MIKDAPTKVIDDVGQEYDPTEVEKEMVDTQDVVRYMERTYPVSYTHLTLPTTVSV